MSILKYFKFHNNEFLRVLPNPKGPLSTSVSSESIATANKNSGWGQASEVNCSNHRHEIIINTTILNITVLLKYV